MTQISLFASCPSCGELVHVDLETCPYCGQQAFDGGVITPLLKIDDQRLRDAILASPSDEVARDRDYLNIWTEGGGGRLVP